MNDIACDCDRIVREALKEPDPRVQVARLLIWLVNAVESGQIEADQKVRSMLGLPALQEPQEPT